MYVLCSNDFLQQRKRDQSNVLNKQFKLRVRYSKIISKEYGLIKPINYTRNGKTGILTKIKDDQPLCIYKILFDFELRNVTVAVFEYALF